MAIEIISASKQISRNKMIDVICKDNNTKIIRLVVPTEVDGVDLSNLTWTINVENANNEKDLQTPSNVAIKDGNILIDSIPYPKKLFCTSKGTLANSP